MILYKIIKKIKFNIIIEKLMIFKIIKNLKINIYKNIKKYSNNKKIFSKNQFLNKK